MMQAQPENEVAGVDCVNDGAGVWRMRRRFIYVTTGFCMGVIAYVLYNDMQSSVADTSVTMSFLAIMSIAGSYVFGATWDDHSARQLNMTGRGRGMKMRGPKLPVGDQGDFGWGSQ